MSKHTDLGKEGEKLALSHLIKLGYKILEVNWIFNHKEIDIIAKYNDEIVFVEVKTRTSLAFELPQEAVTPKKMKNLVYAADIYLNLHELPNESRFDIITVYAKDHPKILEHIEAAFYPNELL